MLNYQDYPEKAVCYCIYSVYGGVCLETNVNCCIWASFVIYTVVDIVSNVCSVLSCKLYVKVNLKLVQCVLEL